MITIRTTSERGRTNFDWLDSRHSFSFGDYYDARHMGFRSLRVINDDRVAGGGGFGMHPHRDMEIITYVIDGQLEHRDSLGNGAVMSSGDLQRMTAGTGVRHSEFNPSPTRAAHFLQIWILPERPGLEPSYEQHRVKDETTRGLKLIAGRGNGNGNENGTVATVHQDVSLYLGVLENGQEVRHAPKPGRHAWVQVIRGPVTVNGQTLQPGDAAAVSDEPELVIRATGDAEFLLFDLK